MLRKRKPPKRLTHSFFTPTVIDAEELHPNSTEHQMQEVLEWLSNVGPANTFELREALGITHPAGIVRFLRLAGYQIETRRVSAEWRGVVHLNVAEYCRVKPQN